MPSPRLCVCVCGDCRRVILQNQQLMTEKLLVNLRPPLQSLLVSFSLLFSPRVECFLYFHFLSPPLSLLFFHHSSSLVSHFTLFSFTLFSFLLASYFLLSSLPLSSPLLCRPLPLLSTADFILRSFFLTLPILFVIFLFTCASVFLTLSGF